MLRYGYISNGFADHTLEQMVQVLRHLGYHGIGITLDHQHLDPGTVSAGRLEVIRKLLQDADLVPVIETGARYYLDAFRKHRPTLVSVERDARRRRLRYYRRAVEIAAEIGAGVVSLWSGTPQPGLGDDRCWAFLEESLPDLLDHAQSHGVVVGFEPEPGMFVEDMNGYRELRRRINHPALQLTLDLGHVAITEAPPFEQTILDFRDDIVNVHIEDVRDRRHEHLPLGEGEIDFPPLLAALQEIGFSGPVLVELSRHSAEAPKQAQHSLIFLRDSERE